MTDLFDPVRLGAIEASSRILMAPMTRGRAGRDAVPTPIMAEYYAQRASAGLIISEATGISRQGLGWPFAPGLWTAEQVEGWKPVTAAVHAAGGRIIAQLWHMGRQVHSSVTGEQPVSASATITPGHMHTYEGRQPSETARALDIAELPGIVDSYARAAEHAIAAGFDGVQIHAANGYLIDQFLRDNSNLRTDRYGGSVENRIRLLDEVTRAVIGAVGADRTAVRLSPNGATQGVDDSDPKSLFVPAAARLSDLGIAFLELREPGPDGTYGKTEVPKLSPDIRRAFAGPLVVNSDYFTREAAQAAIDSGVADAVSFGRAFLANPDLPERLRTGAPLNEGDSKSWYGGSAAGYSDYPAMAGDQLPA